MTDTERRQLLRLVLLIATALTGLMSAFVFGWRGLEDSLPYVLIASGLLCFGLYMAVYGIDKDEARQHWRIVAIAITFGVLCKYIVIFASTYLVTQRWEYAVLGMAVAQIDPLSVAALLNDSRMKPWTRTALNMWAAFDDPVTAVATPIILGIATKVAHQKLDDGQGWASVLLDLMPFILALVFIGLVALWRRLGTPRWLDHLEQWLDESEGGKTILACIGWLTAVLTRLFSLAALLGWVFRPHWLGSGRRAELALTTALYSATFLLGILLAGGVDWVGGAVLGIATYSSQLIAAWLVMWVATLTTRKHGKATSHFSSRDTWHLGLSQQNGITAIVLAFLNSPPKCTIPGYNNSFFSC